MALIKLSVEVDHRYFEREVTWPAIPRVDDLVLLTGADSGWGESVSRVWWDATDGKVTVEFRRVLLDDGGDEPLHIPTDIIRKVEPA